MVLRGMDFFNPRSIGRWQYQITEPYRRFRMVTLLGGTHFEGVFFCVCSVGCNIVNATKILEQCLLHGDMYVCAFGVRSSSAIIQTQLCKYAFAVSVAVGRMGQSVREREHACVRTHTHTHAHKGTETHTATKYKSPHLRHSKSRYEA